ncbi:MAG: hypothetical protein LBD93_03630 [Treponema sp.]|jgi:hypothetical protein|nr:hypothetical protein [Treponema sp.]
MLKQNALHHPSLSDQSLSPALIINCADNLNQEIVDRLIGEKVQLFDDLIAINENSFRGNQEAA